MPLSHFDFSALNDREFKEDSVREDIISPLLRHLGYSSTPPNKIIRSRSLQHPFVQIGTKKNNIKIIPDYIFEISGKIEWLLDAKSPKENIRKGVNVEQAFSYAIHPEVRAFTYALCNGHDLVVFSINRSHPILDVPLKNIRNCYKDIQCVLSPLAFTNPEKLRFKPDFGLYCHKIGLTGFTAQYFYDIGVPHIIKVNDAKYSIFVNLKINDEWYAVSFDFDKLRYLQLLSCVSSETSIKIVRALTEQPYRIDFTSDTPIINITARVSKKIYQNDKESYSPLIVDKFEISSN